MEKNPQFSSKNFCLAQFLFFIILFIVKQCVIYRIYRNISPIKYCLEYFFSDLYFFWIIIFICTIINNVKNTIIKLIWNILIMLLNILFFIDIFTIYYFQSHETIYSLINIGKYWWNWFTIIWIFWVAFFVLILCLCVFFVYKRNFLKKFWKIFSPKIFTILYVALSVIFIVQNLLLTSPDSYPKNIISVNINAINDIGKDIIFLDSKYEDFISYETWDAKNLNIILIFAESLSAIDSYYLWWKNNMPLFDKIQKEWKIFTNFIANWKVSSDAHVSTLIWAIPINNSYEYDFDEWLASFLNKIWYKTTFISTAPLTFLKQRDFIEKVWFQKIIWEEAFKDKKKYSFDSAPDEYLYSTALDEIKNQTWNYFIWMQTISFHSPYDSPYCTSEWNHKYQTLNYADDKLYDFYVELKKNWFFDNWILIILWDHRKREPAEIWESYLFWEMWEYRTVATVIWSWIQAWTKNSNIIQHTDFFHSIKKLLWRWNIQLDTYYNNIFTDKKNRNRWIIAYYNIFPMQKWKKIYKLNLKNIKENYNDIYKYYLTQKKHRLNDKKIRRYIN